MTASCSQTASTAEEFGERLFGAVLGAQLVQAVYLGDRLGYYRRAGRRRGRSPRPSWPPAPDAPSATPASGSSTRPSAACSPWTTRTRPPPSAATGCHPGRPRCSPTCSARTTCCRWPGFVAGLGRAPGRAGRRLPLRRRRQLGRVRHRRPGGAGRGQPAAVPRRAAPRLPAVGPGDPGGAANAAAGSPTSAAATAGRRSGWRWPTPASPWTATTWTPRRSRRPGATPSRPGWPTGCASTWPTPPPPTAGYDLVTAFECIHDLPDPVSVLAAMRRLAGPDGVVLVMDERVAERVHRARATRSSS